MPKVAIVGSGFIGRGWAISFARAGHEVAMWDHLPEATAGARDYIAGVLGDLADNDLLRGQKPEDVLARISTTPDLAQALNGVVYVQENTPENDVAGGRPPSTPHGMSTRTLRKRSPAGAAVDAVWVSAGAAGAAACSSFFSSPQPATANAVKAAPPFSTLRRVNRLNSSTLMDFPPLSARKMKRCTGRALKGSRDEYARALPAQLLV